MRTGQFWKPLLLSETVSRNLYKFKQYNKGILWDRGSSENIKKMAKKIAITVLVFVLVSFASGQTGKLKWFLTIRSLTKYCHWGDSPGKYFFEKFPKCSRTFIEFSDFREFREAWIGLNLKILPLTFVLRALWKHYGLFHKRWQARALLMTNIFVIEFNELTEKILGKPPIFNIMDVLDRREPFW